MDRACYDTIFTQSSIEVAGLALGIEELKVASSWLDVLWIAALVLGACEVTVSVGASNVAVTVVAGTGSIVVQRRRFRETDANAPIPITTSGKLADMGTG